MNYTAIIDKFYPADTSLRDIYLAHCRSVADEALAICRRCRLNLDPTTVEAAAMLHDIGIFATNAPSIHCIGEAPYICHGIIGRDLLKAEGVADEISEVAARHTGAGLTVKEIIDAGLPLPHVDLCPRTQLERLICYADKFYSKSGDMKRKTLDRVRSSMARFGAGSLARFDAMHHEFNIEPQNG